MSAEFRFQAIKLVNWKNFASVDIRIPDRLFLVGPNAAGKSNLLDAFRFLRDLGVSGGGLPGAVKKRGGVSAIRSLSARRHPDIEIHVEVGQSGGETKWEYELSFNQDRQRRPVVRRERVYRNGERILDRPDAKDDLDPDRLTQTHLEQVTSNVEFRALPTFFSSIRYLHIVPQLVREPDRSVGRANDPFGGDFLEQIAKTREKTRQARLKRMREALRVAVPQLSEIELYRDERGAPHVRGKYEHWRPQGAWQTEEQFSDGTLRLMGLLWGVLDGTGPLLLEEPELSLHPGVVRFLPQMLARLQSRSGRQVFASTHSQEMLGDPGIGLDEVLLLRPQREGTEVLPASAIDDAKLLLESGLTIADLVVSRTGPANTEQISLFGEG